ncbi:MAG: SprT family zinc-dependent metalloprotease [Nitrospirales bacterium]
MGIYSSPTVPLSVSDLQSMWRSVAQQYFDGRLPSITIEWSFRLTASTGMFVSQVGPRNRLVSKEHRHGAARRIRLSAPLLCDQSEAEIIRTLAHEMIHQWQYDVKKRWPNHGPDFHEVMARMNIDGLGITVRHSLNRQVEQLSKYLWRCVVCGTSYCRQRRSISSRRHRCGNCHGELQEFLINRSLREQRSWNFPEKADPTYFEPTRPFKDQPESYQLVFNFNDN